MLSLNVNHTRTGKDALTTKRHILLSHTYRLDRMNIATLKISVVIAVLALIVFCTSGCMEIGSQVSNYQSPNICHGTLQNLSFAKIICRQSSGAVHNVTVNLTPAINP